MLVIDASVAILFALPNPNQKIIQEQFFEWINAQEKIYAPTLWAYEVTSALSKGVHFKQLTDAEANDALTLINNLPVELIMPTEQHRQRALQWTYKLKRAAAYDSFYVALAENLDCSLWTRDKKLVNAVNVPWVKLL